MKDEGVTESQVYSHESLGCGAAVKKSRAI